jgi:hypothetical protein
MSDYIVSIVCICLLWIVINFAILFHMTPYEWGLYINPYYVYKTRNINWIGCAILTLLGNALLPLVSVCYWIYFICTVGRK